MLDLNPKPGSLKTIEGTRLGLVPAFYSSGFGIEASG